jgi:fucose 4-O-acetylase-like acetyltransferase
MSPSIPTITVSGRLDYLDAVRAFALLLGVVFHAGLSFIPTPIGWAVMDVSTGPLVGAFSLVSHSFRMPIFFLIAGYFSHLSFHRKGSASFLRTRFIRLVIPFVAGWFILWPLIASGWVMGWGSMRGELDVWAGLKGGFAEFHKFPEDIFTKTHLWFLYYLVLVTGAVLSLRALAQSAGPLYDRTVSTGDACLSWLADRWWAPLAIAVPLGRLVALMPDWGLYTPNTTLVPHIPTVLVYGGCFLLGWALHRNPESLNRLTCVTWDRLVIAGLATGLSIGLSSIQGDPSHPHHQLAYSVFAGSYAVMLCYLVFLTMGIARRLIKRPYPVIRYIANASYWMYLVHLPIVVWMQVAVAEWPLHWSVKLFLISSATILFSLGTYAAYHCALSNRFKPVDTTGYTWKSVDARG